MEGFYMNVASFRTSKFAKVLKHHSHKLRAIVVAMAMVMIAVPFYGQTWNLVTDVSSLEIGDSVIIVSGNFALGTNQTDNNRGAVSITNNDDYVEFDDNVAVQGITLVAGTEDNTFGFYVGNGYLYAASSSKNYLRTEDDLDANGSWEVTIVDGVTTIIAQGENTRNNLRYNSTNNIFSCYASGQQAVSIYKYVEADLDAPVITVVSSITDFSYDLGSGPSIAQTFAVSGSNLTDNVIVSVLEDGDFELCITENGTYSTSLTLSPVEGSLASTTVYVRMKAELVVDNYSGTITIASTGATSKTISLSGSVTDPDAVYYTKVTAAPENDNWTGEYLITYTNGTTVKALSGSNGTPTNYGTQEDISEYLTGVQIIANSTTDAKKVTARTTEGGYSLYLENVGYLGWNSGNSLEFDESVTTGRNEWTISESAGVVSITNVGETSRVLKYNSSSPRFACYTSGQGAITLYKSPREVFEIVAAPTFTPEAGTYSSSVDVTLACSTEGATIYYTLDGTDPTASSTAYTAAITISQTTTIKAIAIKNELSSGIVSATYTITNMPIVATPVISPNGGDFSTPQQVTITCATEGASIYYTLNGDEPTAESTLYEAPFMLNESATVKAIAIKEEMTNSSVASATFTMPVFLENLAAVYSTAANDQYKITGDVVFVFRDGRNMFVKDATAGMMIYDNATSVITTQYNEGDVISGGILGKTSIYRGLYEVVPMANTAESTENLGEITPAVVTISQMTNANDYTSQLVKLVDVTITAINGSSITISDGDTTTVIYDKFSVITGSDYAVNDVITVTGLVSIYNTYQIQPRTAADIVKREPVADPTFSPEAGTFYNDFSVTLACETEGATIYYTLDGTDPTAESIEYTSAISITATTTVKAIAIKNSSSSDIVSATYVMETAAPVFTPEGGTFFGSVDVALSSITQGATIYYTLNETDTQNEYQENQPLHFTTTTTIYARAEKNGVSSTAVSATYTIADLPIVATPTFDPDGGDFENSVEVTLNCTTEDAVIYYTTDGSAPTVAEGILYNNNPFTLTETTTVKAMAVKDGMTDSNIAEATFTKLIPVATPTISPNGGNFVNSVNVTLACTTEGAAIYYTTNGDAPTVAEGTLYDNNPISLTESVTLKAIAVKAGMANSDIAEAVFTKLEQVATPTFNPNGGTFETSVDVTLACATEGASIYYTINGDEPTTESALYVEGNPFSLDATTTVKAIAVKDGMAASEIAEATFTKTEPVVTVNYTRIESLVQLQDGDKVIIASRYDNDAAHYFVAPTRIANARFNAVGVSAENNIISTDVDTIVWTVRIADGVYKFVNASNDTLGNSSSTNFTNSDNYEWNIVEYTAPETAIAGAYAGYKISNAAVTRSIAFRQYTTNSGTVNVFGAYAESNASNAEYNFALDFFVDLGDHAPLVATPTFSLPAGNYTSEQSVEISCATEGATIRYTLDGSNPTEESDEYTAALTISEPTTVKAKAFKQDCIPSGIAEAFYNVVTTPSIIVSAETLNFENTNETKTLNVSSLNLTADITVAVTENFTVDAETIAMNTDATLTVTFIGEAVTNGTLTLTSGETIATVALVANPPVASEGCYYPVAEAQTDWTGDYLITFTDMASETINALNGVHQSNYGTYENIFQYYADGVIASNLTTEVCKVTVAATENGYYSMYLNRNGYLGLNSDANKLYSNNTFTAERDEWIFAANENGVVTITSVKFPGRQIQWNNSNTGLRFACYTGLQSAVTLYKLGALPAVATPVFTPIAGYYEETQNVTITCSTEGATIYYTTDGTEPTTASAQYTEAIEVSQNTTIKAIASLGEDVSVVATARYTFPNLVENIAALYAVENTEGNYKLTGDVTFVFRKDRNMYVMDETGGLLIYDQNSRITTEYNEGDVISGGISGTINIYNGLFEFVPIRNTAESEQNTGMVAPLTITVEQLLTNSYVSQLVKVENVAIETGTTYYEGDAGTNLTFSQNGSESELRNNFKTLDMTIEDGTHWDIVGFASINNGTIQLVPRGNDDVMIVTSVDGLAAEIAIYPNPTSNVVNIAATGMTVERIELANVDGQVISNEAVDADVVTISLENQPAGMYFVRIYTENEVIVRKITKF